MKAIILAGGFGTRLSEETLNRPKPMVEIGGKPILWHIMNIHAAHGIREFIIALGYKGEMIKEYFLNYYAANNDITVDLSTGDTTVHNGERQDWVVHLVDTGLRTQTGGRLRRLRPWLEPDETFLFTYGDGVADIDLRALLAFHEEHGRLATLTSVRTPERFGRLAFEGDRILEFFEKPELAEGWINGGFFVLNERVVDYIEGDDAVWERGPLLDLVSDGQLMGYRHKGFWSCMDTLKEKQYLEALWEEGRAPWHIWKSAGHDTTPARRTGRTPSGPAKKRGDAHAGNGTSAPPA